MILNSFNEEEIELEHENDDGKKIQTMLVPYDNGYCSKNRSDNDKLFLLIIHIS